MSSARPPAGSVEPPPPPSQRRRRNGPDAFDVLSQDGAAAVLLFARAKLEAERRRAQGSVNASLRVFAARVEAAARSVNEGVHDDGVFIAPLFHVLRKRGELASCPTLSAFKARLLQAHRCDHLELAPCERPEDENPLVVGASALRYRRTTFRLVLRWSRRNIHVELEDVVEVLSPEACAVAKDYARKVHEDEKRCEGRPRLITLPLDAFAARLQTVTNEGSEDAVVTELFRELDNRGEVTGLSLDAFKARLRAAHRAGLLALRALESHDGGNSDIANASCIEETTLHLVCRTAAPLPIPWGRPALIVPRARTTGVDVARTEHALRHGSGGS